MYAIMDWHVLTPGNPRDPLYNTPPYDVHSFFTEIAQFVVDNNFKHVLYETANEPNPSPVDHHGSPKWSGPGGLKEYHEDIIKTIRKVDKNSVIICGTNTWSQDIQEAA